MKEIKAIIQPFMLDEALAALHEIEGLPGVTLSEVRAVGMERGRYRQIVKTKLEVMVSANLVERVVTALQKAAHTGNPGDGRIFVIPVEESVSIRTGVKELNTDD